MIIQYILSTTSIRTLTKLYVLVRENFYFDFYAVIITVGHVNKSNKVEGFYGKFNHVPTVLINPMHKKK